MKKVALLFLLLLTGILCPGQVSLSGQVWTPTGTPVPGATVQLLSKGFRQTALSNDSGQFRLQGLAPGSYQLAVQHTGFDLYSGVFALGGSDTSIIVRLTVRQTTLPNVEVTGRTARKYNSDYSFGATRIAVLNKALPQSISTITKELMADRQAFHLADAVQLASGVIPSSYYNQYAIRGISQNEEGQIVNGMRTRQYYFLQPLTTNIERVEVIKGPASATFSSVDPGGSINLVTKKPLATSRREVGISVGSFSTIRGTLDFTGPLNEEKNLLYRINGAYQEARSFRDLVGNKSYLLSPSFSYLPTPRTAVNIELVLSNMAGNLDRGQPIFGAVAGRTDLSSTPISLNLGAASDYFKSRDFMAMVTLGHRFTEKLGLNVAYMKQTWTEDLQEHRTTNAFGVDTANRPVTSLAAMQFVQRRQYWNMDNINSYLTLDAETGSVRHKFLLGYDLHRWEKGKGGGQNAARGYLLKDGGVAGAFDPANAGAYQTIVQNGVTIPRPNVNHFDLANPTYPIRSSGDYQLNVRTALPPALTATHALYIQELLQWRGFSLLLSLRQEWFQDITNYRAVHPLTVSQTALVPRAGLTYTLTKSVNVYATYLEGFQPQSNTVSLMPNTGSLKAGATFRPLTSDLKELGVKADLWQGKMQVNAAIYEINQRNILINANLPAFPDSLATRGGERSRGFELDVAGYLLANWQVNASYSYIDAVITAEKEPALIGVRKQNTPYNSAHLWTRYNFASRSPLNGIGIGLGLQHLGNRIPWFTREFKVPAYTLVDAALYYHPGKGNMQLAFNLNNVLNQTYWIGAQNYLRLFPGAPRNGMLTATYKF